MNLFTYNFNLLKNIMKIFKILIYIFLVFSCKDIQTENNISEFDKLLGKDNVATLNFLVSNFENDFLKRQFPNLSIENAYKQFLIDFRDNKTKKWVCVSKNASNKFILSNLRLEIYNLPDSVWIIKDSTHDYKTECDSIDLNILKSYPYIKSRYKYKRQDNTVEYTYSNYFGEKITELNQDSILKQHKNRRNFNTTGKYMQALRSIKNKSQFHEKYYKQKESAGFLFPDLIAGAMLYEKIDLNDKINRKIIVLEFMY
jgi:hypothetical protein